MSVFLIVLSIILYTKLSLRKKDLLVPEYSVPDNLTPSEIGYLYKGSTDNKHIVSLITYFANKGYLQIIEIGKRNFSFQKLKDIDDSEPEYAKTTFKGLFKINFLSIKNTILYYLFFIIFFFSFICIREEFFYNIDSRKNIVFSPNFIVR